MHSNIIFIILIVLVFFGYFFGQKRCVSLVSKKRKLTSLPQHYGYLVVLWTVIPVLIALFLWTLLDDSAIVYLTVEQLPQLKNFSEDELGLFINEIKNLASSGGFTNDELKRLASAKYLHYLNLGESIKIAAIISLAVIGLFVGLSMSKPEIRARNLVEKTILWIMLACATIAIFTTIGIVFSVVFESIQFFTKVNPFDFMFGTHWSPQEAIREDQVGGSGSFGAIPLFVGTLLISLIALIIAVPLGLLTAIYLSEYASAKFRTYVKPILEILAGIPTVVYGFFAALTVAPFIRNLGETIGLNPSSESALAAGLVMGIMIIPFVSSLSDDVISAVPYSMREGSYGMGATKSETILQVLIPAALPGIVGGVLLAASRAIGETMIVVMAAGLAANLTVNPLEAVTTVTVQIVTLLTGDQEFDSAKTLAAFALGLMLFVVTLILNIISLYIVRKYREQYE